MEVKLIVLEGKQKDRVIPLPETIFLIGRDRQCHIRPHCQSVSKLHCAIAAWAGKVRVRDLKSRNGTFLNGQPIQGEVVVKDGDQLRVGTLVFAFRINNDENLPIAAPITNEGDLKWLLDASVDSSVLLPTADTCVVPAPVAAGSEEADSDETHDGSAELPDGTSEPPGSKDISAGQHLRTYFEKRKRRPRVPAPTPDSDAAE